MARSIFDTISPYASDVFDGFNISIEDVDDLCKEYVGFCGVDLDRVSRFLLMQLTSIRKHRVYSTFSITDVIQDLEGVGRGVKRRSNQFKHLPLKGFWKAHFFDARFMVKNLINETGIEFKNSPKFSELLKKIIIEEEINPSRHGWQGRLSHEMTIGAFEKRAARNSLTGEWIIFSKYEGKNYYLCICRHSSDDQQLFDFLQTLCRHEYPFLISE